MRRLRFLWFSGLVWGSSLVAGFPAKMAFAGNLVLSADDFPRQGGFGGFSGCYLN
jgi:hypothetical protein